MTTRAADAALVSQYLSFVVGGTDFGVPILKVKEILQYEVPTRVPGTPRSIRGVVNVRGAVVPIVDLGVKFGNGEVPPTKLTCVLVVEVRADAGHLVLGVLADAVNEGGPSPRGRGRATHVRGGNPGRLPRGRGEGGKAVHPARRHRSSADRIGGHRRNGRRGKRGQRARGARLLRCRWDRIADDAGRRPMMDRKREPRNT